MKLLVTGAGGMIGGAVVRLAAKRGIDVTACGRHQPSGLPGNVAWISADLTDIREASRLIEQNGPTHILHAAWETRRPSYWNDPVNLDWVIATAAMAGAFAQAGGRRFLQVGTCAEYDWNCGPPRGNTPATRYGKAKLAAFRAIETAGHAEFATVEARIFWVYGPGEDSSRLIPTLFRSYTSGIVPELGSGQQLRDIVHIDDAARALLLLLDDDAPEGVVDIGNGQGTLLANVADRIARLTNADETGLGRCPDRPDDPVELIADPRRLRSTGWTPEISLEDGLSRLFSHWSLSKKDNL